MSIVAIDPSKNELDGLENSDPARRFVSDFIYQLDESSNPKDLSLIVVRHIEADTSRAAEIISLAKLVYSIRIGQDLVW